MTEEEKDELFYHSKRRARSQYCKFSLQRDKIIFPTHCPIFNIKLDYTKGTFTNKNHPRLVRKNNIDYKPYSPENTWIISRKAHEILENLTINEIKLLGKAIKEHINDN